MDLQEFLDRWRADLAAVLDRVLPLLELRFSYPPDHNTIGPKVPTVPLDIPADLSALYRRVGPVTLPDIGNGLLIEPPDRLDRCGEAVAFARAGGTRFRINLGRVSRVADDGLSGEEPLAEFLARFRDAVVAFADTGERRDL